MFFRTVAILGLLLMIPQASIAGDDVLTDEWRAAYDDQIDSEWALGVIDDIDAALAEIAGLTETLVADGELSEDGAEKLLALVAKVGKDIVEERFGTPEERSERPELLPFNGVSKGNSSYDSEYREQSCRKQPYEVKGDLADGVKAVKSIIYVVTDGEYEKTMEIVVGADGVMTIHNEDTGDDGEKTITIISDDGKVYITGDGLDEEIDIDGILEGAGAGIYYFGEDGENVSVDELLDLQGGITHLKDIELELEGLHELAELGEFKELEELEDFQDIHAQVLKEIEGLKGLEGVEGLEAFERLDILDELKVLKEIQTIEEYLPDTLETELEGIEAELDGFEAELDALLKEIEELLRGFVEESKSA